MSGGGFLSRWSRLKRGEAPAEPTPEAAPSAGAADPAPAARAVPPDSPAAGQPGPPPAADPTPPPAAQPGSPPPPEAPPFDLASLPKLEDLTAESDIGAFLRPGVPAALRSAALRRIWSLDPEIRSFVGPADYAWDFNAPDGVPGFALELGGEVRKLLAQAIGQPDPDETPPGEPPGGPTPVEAAAPDAAPPELAPPDLAPADGAPPDAAPPDVPLPAAIATAPAAEALPAASPMAGPPDHDAEPARESLPAPARRRHGGAMPA